MALIRTRAPLSVALAIALLGPSPASAASRHANHPPVSAKLAPEPADANATLDSLFADDERAELALDPIGTLGRGEQISLAQFEMLFTPHRTTLLRQADSAALARLARIDPARLDAAHRISYEVFRSDKELAREELLPANTALTDVRPFNHFGGFHVEYASIAAGDGAVPLNSVADYEANLARDKALGVVFGNAIARFREGMASGVVEPRLTVRNMVGQIDALLAQPVMQSPFYSPVRQFPESFRPATRRRLAGEYRRAILADVYPAYRKLRAFLADEYLPAARESVGLSQMKGGPGLYRLLVRENTTLDLDPDAIHQLGLGEVARIQAEMEQVKTEMGFSGPLRDFFDHLRTDPQYHPKTAAQLADGFHAVGRKVDALAPQYFLHLPRTPLLIEPYPDYRAKYEAGGSYTQGSPDGTRPGTFFFNTYDLKSRFLTGVTTLYLHEGAPGHHFQISLAQENESLPDFQRFGGNTAYVEGWALYAETLGYQMGFYKDPWQHWGTLDDEMLRAMRLVVDTGLHTKGWSREQAIDYMLANSGMGRSDATAEVERYIAIPGQALAYKIGALTIQRLRGKAESELGARFDIRQFHNQVLGSGALPLPVLEAKIDRWIAATKARG